MVVEKERDASKLIAIQVVLRNALPRRICLLHHSKQIEMMHVNFLVFWGHSKLWWHMVKL